MFKKYLINSVKFIGKGTALISLSVCCEYVKDNRDKDIRFIHRWI